MFCSFVNEGNMLHVLNMCSYPDRVEIIMCCIQINSFRNGAKLSVLNCYMVSKSGIMEHLKPPGYLSFEGSIADNWKKWKKAFDWYASATELAKKSDLIQATTFLTLIGEEGQELFNTLAKQKDDEEFAKTVKVFEDHCVPKKNITFLRYRFFSRNQNEDEKITPYVTDLRKLASVCEFGELTTSLIRDRIVCGIKNNSQRERLLRESDLDLEKAITLCRSSEVAQEQLSQMSGSVSSSKGEALYAIKKSRPPERSTQQQSFQQRSSTSHQSRTCSWCGKNHPPRKCPAYGQTCSHCKKLNHFATVCMSRNRQVNNMQYETQDDDQEETTDSLYIGAIDSHTDDKTSNELWEIKAKVNDNDIVFKLDTGAQANIMSARLFKKICRNEAMEDTKARLTTYSGEKLKVIGKCVLVVETKKKYEAIEFIIVDIDQAPILGIQGCKMLELIQRVYNVENEDPVFQKYADVFEGIGCISSAGEHHIHLDKSVAPVIHAPRKVPLALRDRYKAELDRLEELNIVSKVKSPTSWVNSSVIVEKANGELRICLDPKDLNKTIQREHY